MRNKKIVTILLDRGNTELTLIMFQKTMGISCDNLKRAGTYRGKVDFLKQIKKAAHKYCKYISVEVVDELFPNGEGMGVYMKVNWKIPHNVEGDATCE